VAKAWMKKQTGGDESPASRRFVGRTDSDSRAADLQILFERQIDNLTVGRAFTIRKAPPSFFKWFMTQNISRLVTGVIHIH
jgi:hypothetical protein